MGTEAFTTFTEVDPNSLITIDSDSQVTVDAGTKIEYLYKDFGLDFFDDDFQHNIDYNIAGGTGENSDFGFWMLSNTTCTVAKHDANNWPYLLVRFRRDAGASPYKRTIVEHDGTSSYSITFSSGALPGYYEIIRDETVGSFGRLTLKEYSEAARTNLTASEYLDLHVKTDFRFIYAVTETQNVGGVVSNLEIYTEADLAATLPMIETFLGGGGLLATTLPMVTPFLGGGGLLSPTLPMIETFLGGGGLIGATFPMITPTMEGSDNLNHGNIYLTMPMITASLAIADKGTLAATIPMITAQIGMAASAALNATLPMITANGLGGVGGFLEAELPLITVEARSGALLNIDVPMITASLNGLVGEIARLNQTLPILTVSIAGKVEVLGNIDADLPMILPYITGLTGKVIDCAVTLPMIKASISGYNDLNGDLAATLPLIKPYMTGTPARFASCSVLRHREPI